MQVNFLEWSFEVDKIKTANAYSQMEQGAAERCGCESCMIYAARRLNTFPAEVLDLFNETGINFAKEVGLYEAARFEGVIIYGGWFHFAGNILSDTNDKIYTDKDGKTVCNMFKLKPLFDMGFWESDRANYFDEPDLKLVQIEFVIMLAVDDMPESHDFLNNMI